MLASISKTTALSRLFAAAWLAGAVLAAGAAAGQKPVRHVEIHGEGIQPPDTLDELWATSAVVIDGRVAAVRPANQTFTPATVLPPGTQASPATLAQTDYVIEVHRVLKSDGVIAPDATSVVVRRLGGTVDRGDYLASVAEPHFAPFQPRGRYLLFLKPAKGQPAPGPVYVPVVGADSAFALHGDRVVPLGRSVASRKLADLGVQQLVAALSKRGGK